MARSVKGAWAADGRVCFAGQASEHNPSLDVHAVQVVHGGMRLQVLCCSRRIGAIALCSASSTAEEVLYCLEESLFYDPTPGKLGSMKKSSGEHFVKGRDFVSITTLVGRYQPRESDFRNRAIYTGPRRYGRRVFMTATLLEAGGV